MQPWETEQMYFSTVHDIAELLVSYNVDTETMLSDVLDAVLRVKPESRQAFQLLGILDYFTQLKAIDDANEIASEVFKA
jgi:hypothetical protein